jgi:GNAT superfamily N-acetyltransferase
MARTSDPTALKRAGAGSYRTADERFTVEQASGRWLVLDAEQVDDLGLPLTRGPFATLDDARAAIADARQAPAPTSRLARRMQALRRDTVRPGKHGPPRRRASSAAARPEAPPRPEIRTYRPGDGVALRAFWETVGFSSLGDDDDSLDRLAERNPGLVIVATAGEAVVGTALGAWDGRRGWIYHVAVAEGLRRAGLGGRIVHEVERRLRALGCLKVNVIVKDDSEDAARFWAALGYSSPPARQYGRELWPGDGASGAPRRAAR